MKILVVGGKRSVSIIQHVAENTKLIVDLEYLYTDTYEEIVTELELHQTNFDGILFTGATPFEYVSGRVQPLIPWESLPQTPQAFLAALLKASYKNQWNLQRVSVDTYPPELIHNAYDEIGLSLEDLDLHIAKFQPNEENYIEYLIEFHTDNYRSRRVSFCITGNIAVANALAKNHIPYVKIDPPTDIIIQYINALRLRHQLNLAEYNLVATIMIDIEIYTDQLYKISELERFHSANKAKEAIYVFALNNQAAVFEKSDGHFVLFTTLYQLEQYSDHFKIFPLFQNIRRSENIKNISIGIGLGTDSYSAKSNAENSLLLAHRQEKDCLYLTYENGNIAGPFTYETIIQESDTVSTANKRLLEISLRSQVGMNTLKKLEAVIQEHAIEVTTPQQMAELMNMSPRNMNRLLSKLEECGYVKIAGKETRVSSGRPSRLIRFYF